MAIVNTPATIQVRILWVCVHRATAITAVVQVAVRTSKSANIVNRFTARTAAIFHTGVTCGEETLTEDLVRNVRRVVTATITEANTNRAERARAIFRVLCGVNTRVRVWEVVEGSIHHP